jgi:uncharacterized protein YcbX
MILRAIARYPVKSCRGESLDSAVVEPWGLAGDRRWMAVDDAGDAITAREIPTLVRTNVLVRDGSLTLRHPAVGELTVTATSGKVSAQVWDHPVIALDAGPAAAAWFSEMLGVSARLVHLDDPTQRPTNPLRTGPDDRVSLADAYPLLLANQSSLDALNDLIAEGPLADEGPLPMVRFRPNLVVGEAAPWAEDGWRRLRIGEAEFRVVKGCDRCVFTTIDPDTARKGKEPIATLARHRRWDGKTWFAVNLVPDTPWATVRVGDRVEVLDEVSDPDGPLR